MESLVNWHPYWLSFPNELKCNDLDTNVIDFIMNCYHSFEGGFGDYPEEKDSFVNSTAKGIICLDLLKKMDKIKRIDVYSFLRGCQNSDFGFAITTSPGGLYPSNLESTFYSIMTINSIGYLPRLKLHQPKIVNWIVSHYNIDGGFRSEDSVLSNVYYTFQALLVLNLLKSLDRIDPDLTISYLINKQADKNPEVTLTTSGLLSLYLLTSLEELPNILNIKIATSRLARCQNKTGGFRKKKIDLIYKSDMLYTFQSIIGLNVIGKYKRIKKEKAIEWILSCQNDDGGFGNKPESNSSISNTFYALISLYYLTSL
ncbi:MAG: prenyltransferase/squalene oxidase repeat-containing protein [Candidatus Hodarchaeota archaeon]